jgi:hypothetical protein
VLSAIPRRLMDQGNGSDTTSPPPAATIHSASSESKSTRFIIEQSSVNPTPTSAAPEKQPTSGHHANASGTSQPSSDGNGAAAVNPTVEATRRGRFEVTSQPSSVQTSPTDPPAMQSPRTHAQSDSQSMKPISLPPSTVPNQARLPQRSVSQPMPHISSTNTIPSASAPALSSAVLSEATFLNQLTQILHINRQQNELINNLVGRLKGVVVQEGKVSLLPTIPDGLPLTLNTTDVPDSLSADASLNTIRSIIKGLYDENQKLKAENQDLKSRLAESTRKPEDIHK